MTDPYYVDSHVTLYLGDCREITDWLTADVLVTDPPYGIGWCRGNHSKRANHAHGGIANDNDTMVRDAALAAWGERPAIVFGSLYAPFPPARLRHICIYRKPVNAGVVGSTTGFRRDVEAIFLLGPWPHRAARWSSVLITGSTAGGPSSLVGRTGHPHAKPPDVMEALIDICPPSVIADPFAGAGSTLVAARKLGRRAIGVEIHEPYCEIAARRLDQGVLPFEPVSR